MRNLTYFSFASAILATSLFSACADKTPPDDDFSSFAATDDGKADSFSYRMKTVGALTYGETSATVSYTASPRYRAFTFAGNAGDKVDVWVRSPGGGDAVAWILDNTFHTLGSNDDADSSTLDSHITLTLPANASSNHYIVFRDYSGNSEKFTVTLNGTLPYSIACTADDDCLAVPQGGCCPHGYKFAVNKSSVAAYDAATKCETPSEICSDFVVDDTRVAKCNHTTDTCEMINPPE